MGSRLETTEKPQIPIKKWVPTFPCIRAAICAGVKGFAMAGVELSGVASALLAMSPIFHMLGPVLTKLKRSARRSTSNLHQSRMHVCMTHHPELIE